MYPALPPDATAEDLLLPISALQHYLFCPRQCALIHVERLWAENSATAEGRILHEKADSGKADRRGGLQTLRSVQLRSFALGVAGVADVVEKRGQVLVPVEYKRGKPKAHRADEVQLCAQALCLEEMFSVEVPEGMLFYGAVRRRHPVAIDAELRALTTQVARDAREMVRAGRTPAPVWAAKLCRACSMAELCRPKRMMNPPNVLKWLARMIES
ncbi:CRISPR-associated protein Cas4 [Novosphingobium sp. AAP83]|uniref:CRISPR-associated protein Cas4 n=1 Tax=Novosphingobium sp. AAP83 TaxID=1523425 RepID=UPI0006B8B2FE|nr:CRISPR-associated protein Cas4 [Novosphingobium sp. AAP83]KPF91894.1 CRISPR-associated protein Cas4 [Novosphingobium sp. AAP83]